MSSICEQATDLGDKLFWQGFSRDLINRHIPYSGSLALTNRCNLHCVHCYLKDEPASDSGDAEWSTDQWLKIISEIKEAGCLYLLLTGGDPLLREDFSEIYSHIKRNGFLVTVFTNGTLISDRIAELLGKLPPRLVEISLYGASTEIHDRITGIPGSFMRAIQGIEKLIGMGISVGLKSVLMTLNQEEFPAIGGLAQRYGIKFRTDAAIFPTLNGDRGPIGLRVSPQRAVALEMADPKRVREWREYYRSFRIVPKGKQIFTCNAGRTTFHIDPNGDLFPCLIARSLKYSLKLGDFAEGWEKMACIRQLEADDDFPCNCCENKLICGFCPGLFELESGQNQIPSDYVCAIGKLRQEIIMNES